MQKSFVYFNSQGINAKIVAKCDILQICNSHSNFKAFVWQIDLILVLFNFDITKVSGNVLFSYN